MAFYYDIMLWYYLIVYGITVLILWYHGIIVIVLWYGF